MTRLRWMMLEELERRNYDESTIRHYIRRVEQYARFFPLPDASGITGNITSCELMEPTIRLPA